MAVIRAGRTRLVKAGIIGAFIGLVPGIIMCVVLALFVVKKDVKLEEVNETLSSYQAGTVCVLKNDMERGQQITLDDVRMVEGIFLEGETFKDVEHYVGMYMKTDAPSGTILNDCVATKDADQNQNLRTYYVDYIDIPKDVATKSTFDIRIRFPNGEDYLVAGNKSFKYCDEEGFFVDLTRREALLLSSAKVDCDIYTGAMLYGAIYTNGFEEEELLTYPVNTYVFRLGQWEPNLSEAFGEEMFEKREVLEENLLEFMGVTNNMQ